MKKKLSKSVLRNRSVFTALFAALISVSALVQLSAGPFAIIPLVLQNMMALLSGAILGAAGGAVSVSLFVISGALGLPVYAGGRGGFAILLGPTGGFLIGYILGSFVCGLILGMPSYTEKRSFKTLIKTIVAGLSGFIIIYIPGLLWYTISYVMKRDTIDFSSAVFKGAMEAFLPFIPGDLVKLILFVLLTRALRPVSARYLNPDDAC
ncbi:MAG: biotin transporter BioY [Spirochaetaceae bacterium]|jgi:biotin transport system substrate-specific component|nr:biotin transporter BioY [Spirochaetaceae bacterium]